jgi:hypothetical protein
MLLLNFHLNSQRQNAFFTPGQVLASWHPPGLVCVDAADLEEDDKH